MLTYHSMNILMLDAIPPQRADQSHQDCRRPVQKQQGPSKSLGATLLKATRSCFYITVVFSWNVCGEELRIVSRGSEKIIPHCKHQYRPLPRYLIYRDAQVRHSHRFFTRELEISYFQSKWGGRDTANHESDVMREL